MSQTASPGMSRRGFFKRAGLLIGGVALEQAVPAGRVWFFPRRIVAPPPVIIEPAFRNVFLTPAMITAEALRILQSNLVFESCVARQFGVEFTSAPGRTISVKMPERFV